MRQKDQKMRYSNAELSLIKNTFAGDDTYLYAVRKHMLGVVMEDEEQKVIKQMTPSLKVLLRKVFMPSIDGDSPLFQVVDMAMGLSTDFKGRSVEEGRVFIEIKKVQMDYIKGRLDAIEEGHNGGDLTLLIMSDLSSENAYVNINARNYLLSYIDSFCNELRNLAGMKDETVEETMQKIVKNSSK